MDTIIVVLLVVLNLTLYLKVIELGLFSVGFMHINIVL